MNCPLCDGILTIDEKNKWIMCDSNNHKYKLTEFDDVTRKTITLRILSDSVMAVKGMIKTQEGKIDKINEAYLNGQISAWQSMAEYLRDNDWRDYEELKGSKSI